MTTMELFVNVVFEKKLNLVNWKKMFLAEQHVQMSTIDCVTTVA